MQLPAGSVAIITGAGQPLGAAVAQALAAAGARTALCDVNPDRVEQTAELIRAAGGEALALTADVSNRFQCAHLVDTTRAAWGRLDLLVNAAWVAPRAPLLKFDEWDWNRCLDVNLKAVFLMSQLVGRVFSWENAERGGAIVNLAWTVGVEHPLAEHVAFCAASAGVVGLTRECARAYAAFGTRVNALLIAGEPAEASPTAVARAALWLCSPAAGQLTGQLIALDDPRLAP